MLSIIIPAEAQRSLLNRCLKALIASEATSCPIELVVVVNDDLLNDARSFESEATARGWQMQILKLDRSGRRSALNLGDAAAKLPWRAYVSDMAAVSPKLLDELCRALDGPKARYVCAGVSFETPSLISRAYLDAYQQVLNILPLMQNVQLYAVNAAGRARWSHFPDTVSDDLFVKLLFRPDEMAELDNASGSIVVKDLQSLVQAKIRKENSIKILDEGYPELMSLCNGRVKLNYRDFIAIGMNNPIGFLLFFGLDFFSRIFNLSQIQR